MRVLSVNYPKQEEDNNKIQCFKEHYEANIKKDVMAEADVLGVPTDLKIKKRQQPGCCTQFKMICRRNRQQIARNPMVFKARMGQNVVLGIIAALIFQSAGRNCTNLQEQYDTQFRALD